MRNPLSDAITSVIEQLLRTESVKATKYLARNHIVRAVRRLYRKRIDRRDRRIEIILTIGRPNYVEREFVRSCIKAKEPFPIKKVQLKLYKPLKSKDLSKD